MRSQSTYSEIIPIVPSKMVLAAHCLCSTLDGVETDFNVALVCSPRGDADPHGCLATQFLRTSKYFLPELDLLRPSSSLHTERDQDLIDAAFIKDFVSDRLKIVCHSSCIATGSDQPGLPFLTSEGGP
jgi:hypothetical protein